MLTFIGTKGIGFDKFNQEEGYKEIELVNNILIIYCYSIFHPPLPSRSHSKDVVIFPFLSMPK
jgi:hypothetical protein